ncbi:MAG: ATP-grasp domain-containing protein [Propionibacteriaceae bacterium]|jgi:biotin carboxylase|nr:ATP-grasp domain-containing protein [Propionibacteriaceae bacterium]
MIENNEIVCLVEPSFFGVSFALEAKRAGCHVVALVSDRGNPSKYGYQGHYDDLLVCDIRNGKAIHDAISASRHSRVDALIAATDYVLLATAEAAERLGLGGMSPETAALVRNKDLARLRYRDRGVPGAAFATVVDEAGALAAAALIGYPVVLKPTNAASSQNVFFVAGPDDMTRIFPQMRGFTTSYLGFPVRPEYLVEEYLDGPEFSVEIFVANGRTVFAEVTEKLTSPLPYFVEVGHVFPTSALIGEKAPMIALAARALEAVGLTDGPAHVELKQTAAGPRIVEVNGRPGGDQISSVLMPAAYGINPFRQAISSALGRPLDFTVHEAASCAIGFICAEHGGEFETITGLTDVLGDESVIRSVVEAQPGDGVRVPQSSDDRLGHIIVRQASPSQAKRKIVELMAKMKVVVR